MVVFFFSTALVFGSWFSLLTSDKKGQTTQSASFAISLVCVGLVTVLSVVIYSVAASETLQKRASPFPPTNYLAAQLACAVVAVVYTLYVSTLIGVFDKPATAKVPAVTERV